MRRILCALIVLLSATATSAQQRFAPPKVTTLTGLSGNQGDIVNLVGTGDYLCSASTCTSASDWKQITSGASAGAPSDATYITKTPNSTLSAEQALSTLSTGLMKVTTTTGAVSSEAFPGSTKVLYDNGGAIGGFGAFDGRSLSLSMFPPSVLGTLTSSPAFGYGVTAVYVQGNYVYATIGHGASDLTGVKHFIIVDISNRAVPRLVGSLPATSDASDTFALTVYGNYAFIGSNSGTNHLEIVDVSDPAAPAITGVSTDSKLDVLAGIAVQGHYLYAGGATDHRLVVVDIIDPAAPVVVGSVQDATKLSYPNSVAIQGNYAYVTGDSSTGWVNVINIEDPTAPTITGSVSSATTLSFAAAIAVVGSYAYVCRGQPEIEGVKKTFAVVDVSNPASPTVASSYRSATDAAGIGGCNGLAAAWPYVVMSGYPEDSSAGNAVTVLNVAVPTSTPVLVTNLAVDPWAAGTGGYVAWAGRDLIVTTYEPSLSVLSVGGAFVPTMDVGSLNIGFGHVADSLVISNYLSVGSGVQVGERGVNSQGPLGGDTLSIAGAAVFGAGVKLATGTAVKTDTTTAHTALFQAYDVDGTAYKTFATLTNGNTPDFTITAPSGGTITVAPTTLTIPSGTSLTGGTVTARLVTNGTAPTVADVGASSCGTTAAAIAGNSNTGEITVGATAGTQCRITFPTAAAVRYNCTCSDSTTAALCRSTFVDTTHSDIFGAFTAGDVVEYICLPR